MLWFPVVYPGFSWDNLTRPAPDKSLIPRRKGQFLWEQFTTLSKLAADTVYVAMFDEVDEGTTIFKVTNSPPTPRHFVGYEGMPSDWYLRLVGAGRARDIPRLALAGGRKARATGNKAMFAGGNRPKAAPTRRAT